MLKSFRPWSILPILLLSTQIHAGFESFDWIRGKVNESWYGAIVGSCQPTANAAWSKRTQENFQKFAAERRYCSLDPKIQNAKNISEINSELQEKIFFDAIVADQCVKNQCLTDYWSALSMDPNLNLAKMASANKELVADHSQLKNDLSLEVEKHPKSEELAAARTAQENIVRAMIASAKAVYEKTMELDRLEINRTNMSKRANLKRQIEVLETTVPLLEDDDAQNFYRGQIFIKVARELRAGRPLNEDELIRKCIENPRNNFQKAVVEKKLKRIAEAQQEMADMHGNYNNQHAFKVASFQNGNAESLLYGTGELGSKYPYFNELSCNLQSKYGVGSDLSTLSNGLVVGAVTAVGGGAVFAVGKLAQAGMVAPKAVQVVSTTSAAVSGAVSATDLAVGVVQGCFDSNAGKQAFSACPIRDSVKSEGIVGAVNKDLHISDCLASVALSAVAGYSAFRQAAVASKADFASKLASSDLTESYSKVLSDLAANSKVPNSLKAGIHSELKKALNTVNREGRPSENLIKALGEEDPESLLTMLKEINASSKKTWIEKVKDWFKSKNLKPDEQEELSACLIQPSGPQ